MLDQAPRIFEMELFFNFLFPSKQKLTILLTLKKLLFPGILYLGIICNVITFLIM